MSKKAGTILVVDDEPLNLAVLSRLLNPVYRVLATRSGASAVTLAATEQPDLILLDVKMPGMDGHAVLAALQQQEGTRDIPVIFVSALGDDGDEELGLALGAVDYVVKPVRPAVVLARVRTQLEIKQHRDRLRQQNGSLEQELARRVDELLLAQELMLSGMAELAETRDSETGNHVLRTQHYVDLLARQLRHDPRHADDLDEAQIAVIAATLKKKLDVDVAPKIILGACRPQLAHQALQADPRVAALLPCNVVVSAHGDGSLVEIMDPGVMPAFTGTAELDVVATEARTLLGSMLDTLTGAVA